MKYSVGLLAFALAACSAQEEIIVSSFYVHQGPASPQPNVKDVGDLVWSSGSSGEMIATIYVTLTMSQDSSKASGRIRGNAEKVELCYDIPYFTKAEMPAGPIMPLAWYARAEFRIRGLQNVPKNSTLRRGCANSGMQPTR